MDGVFQFMVAVGIGGEFYAGGLGAFDLDFLSGLKTVFLVVQSDE